MTHVWRVLSLWKQICEEYPLLISAYVEVIYLHCEMIFSTGSCSRRGWQQKATWLYGEEWPSWVRYPESLLTRSCCYRQMEQIRRFRSHPSSRSFCLLSGELLIPSAVSSWLFIMVEWQVSRLTQLYFLGGIGRYGRGFTCRHFFWIRLCCGPPKSKDLGLPNRWRHW